MPDDYEKAAIRHFKDAQILAQERRYDNAGHLIGFAAECALKKKLRDLHKNEHANYDGHHKQPLTLIRIFLERSRMAGPWLALCRNPNYFVGWNISQRYASDGTITEQQFNIWPAETKKVLAMARIYDKDTSENKSTIEVGNGH